MPVHRSNLRRVAAAVLAAFLVASLAVVVSVLLPGAAGAATAGDTYVPVAPGRLLHQSVAPGGKVALTVTGQGGLPGSGVAAVVLNVTVAGPAVAGNIAVYPDGGTVPNVSNVNFVPGQTIANLVVVQVADNGVVDLLNRSAGSVLLIADVSGYYTPAAQAGPGQFYPLTPSRIMDTLYKPALGASPIAAGQYASLSVGGVGPVPANATAVVLNVTVANTVATGDLVVWGDGDGEPGTSNLNFVPKQTVPNLVVAAIGADGKVDFANESTATLQVIADLAGYVVGGVPTGIGTSASVSPSRILKTPAAPHSTTTFAVAGEGGIPKVGVSAVILNVTAAVTTAVGDLRVWGAGSMPYASNLNFVARQTVPNLVIAKLSPSGGLSIYNESAGSTLLLADVEGFILSAPPTPASSTSRYVRDLPDASLGITDPTTMNSEGCADATANGTSGNWLELLDIGAQSIHNPPLSASDPGVELTETTTRVDHTELVNAITNYIAGYAGCHTGTSTVTVAVGTNTDGVNPAYPAATKGADWANLVVNPIRSNVAGDSFVTVDGAIDIEAGYGDTEANAQAWETAFLGATSAALIYNGSADACPTGVTGQLCNAAGQNGTWTQANYYQLTHDAASPDRIVALPQIYVPIQALQWGAIDRTGFGGSTSQISFVGSLTQYGVCGACSLTPAEAAAELQAQTRSVVPEATDLEAS